jgi:hypothetical protein
VEAAGDPDFVIVCNCKACQMRTGSPFGTGAYFKKADLTVSGEAKGWRRSADSGRAIENFFCPSCGTNVYWTLEMRPDHIGVGFGLFETALPEPARAIWTEEKHGWVIFPEHWPQFEKGTPEP